MANEEAMEAKTGGGLLSGLVFGFLFLACLLTFTLVKVPQPKIHAWLLGTLNQQMNPLGIQASADEGRIILGLGLKYEMTGVRLTMLETQKVLKFSRLEVAPDLIVPLLQGMLGGHFVLEEGTGAIAGNVKMKGDEFDVDVRIENLNLGRMGILPFAAGLDGTADVNGSIRLAGSASAVTGLTGKMNLVLAKIVIDAQKFQGFDIPRTAIADGVVDLEIGSGKATLTTVRLGKPGGADDLQGTTTGDVKLNRAIAASEANLRVKFGFSDRYRQEKTISLLDSLLGMFKRPDASFAMRLTGPITLMQPAPDP